MHRLTTLGAVDLRNARGHPVREVLAQPKRVALLAYLTIESRRGPVSRDKVLALFWPESDETRARNALSQSLHHVRQALGSEVIENHGAGALRVSAELWCDAVEFGAALERGDAAMALDLYRGEFCPSLFAPGAPEVEQWLDEQRASLRRRAAQAARAFALQLLDRGDAPAAIRMAQRALALKPDDEADVREMLSLLERAGDSAAALGAYRDYEQRLAVELETTPAAETKRLAEEIRQRRESAIATAPSSATALTSVPSVPSVASNTEGDRTWLN